MPVAVGPFALVEPIGRGGMGTVWRAVHVLSSTVVAVKVLRAASGDASLAAFRNEVRAVARLDHPGIAMVLDVGEAPSGEPWFAMEHASRGTLAHRANLPRNAEELERMLLQLLDALAHAHARDVIHRDLKPRNVVV